MVEELCTRYGDLYMIWFDGGADDPRGDGPDVEPIVNKYQPNCLFYHNIDPVSYTHLSWAFSNKYRKKYKHSTSLLFRRGE